MKNVLIFIASLIFKLFALSAFVFAMYFLLKFNLPSDKSTAWGYLIYITIGISLQFVFGVFGMLISRFLVCSTPTWNAKYIKCLKVVNISNFAALIISGLILLSQLILWVIELMA
ncbi:MAG TPA: hypothetical protein DCZ94_02870 [Lentisphaeria bacterium]|nr:MAG: hypothetical protein A2X48_03565 [Lentisphaerae bacterium GWF2_49_21]HBC85876.1 hypothetical protein [Lentisphaeria bacterium]